MPRKQRKPKEQKLAEEFFPVDKDDLKYAIEKPYFKPDFSSLIKIEEKGQEKKSLVKKPYKKGSKITKTKAKKKTTKKKIIKEFKAPNLKLKKNGYELIITEKPQAALKIASALGKTTKRAEKSVPYYEVNRKSKKIIVACAVGHLFTLSQRSQNTDGGKTPFFDIIWVPNYLARKNDFSKRYYDVLVKLVKNAGSITVATDYDIEGEVIGLNVVRFIAGQTDAERMKFSTLTEKELNTSYDSKLKSIDWGQAIAGETRHYLDWYYGINLSRALMDAIKTTGKFRIMSIGRVQGPALNLIVKKEKEILAFKSRKYWQVFIKIDKPEIELLHNKDIFNKSELKKFENLIGKTCEAETEKTQKNLPPNPPFNLTTLQTESYALFGITPSKTLQIAQSLYLQGLISYPRTSSQKLPPSINYKEILKTLSKKYKVEKLITKGKPIEGKKTDPAHPSIYPTGQNDNTNALNDDERKIYDLIIRRFLALFMDDAIVDNKKIKVIAESGKEKLLFTTKGTSIKKKSWISIYPSRIKEKEIPDASGQVKIIDLRTEEKETQPPRRYSPASIISELEKRNLGTKCLTGDSKIIFNGKPISMEEIFKKAKKKIKKGDIEIRKINGTTISLTKKGAIMTSQKMISKRKIKENEKVINVKTDLCSLNLTDDHLIYVIKENKIKEIPAKNLNINDKIIGITKKYSEGEIIIKKEFFNKKFKIKNNQFCNKFSSKTIKGIATEKLPIKWSTSLAWILGYYYGDGSYSNPRYNGSHQFCFTTTENKALNLLKENIKQVFGVEPYCYDLNGKYKVNCNSAISYFFAKTFPEIEGKKPFNIPPKFIGDFLRGFFDADGNVHLRPLKKTKIKGITCNSFNTPRIKITLAREDLIKWVSNLLNKQGIKNKVSKGFATCNNKKFNCWTILISRKEKVEKFAYKIGFDSYKEDILYKGLKCDSYHYKVLVNSARIYLLLNKQELNPEDIAQKLNISRYLVMRAIKHLFGLGFISKRRLGNRSKQKWVYSIKEKNQEYEMYCIKLSHKKFKKNIYEMPIREIKEKNYVGYVYDISVDKTSPNFVTEGNLLVHNSTRSSILETLYDRGYIKDQSIKATPLGISLIETLEKHSPIIIDESLTRDFEHEMGQIQKTKKNHVEKEKKILDKSKDTLTKIYKQFKKEEEEIGKELLEANIEFRKEQQEENKLNICPKCKKGNLTIKYSKKTKRYFVACDKYPDCTNTYTLPPNGSIKKTNNVCEECGFPHLIRLSKGKRPWEFCFNPECPKNKQRIEEYRKKQEENQMQ